MKIEDIVESFNSHIEDKRKKLNLDTRLGHFILQRVVKPHETFKAYKEFDLTLWFVKGNNRYKVIIINAIERIVSNSQEENIIKRMNTELCKKIFELINSDLYNKIIEGKYE